MRHRDAEVEESRSPSKAEYEAELAAETSEVSAQSRGSEAERKTSSRDTPQLERSNFVKTNNLENRRTENIMDTSAAVQSNAEFDVETLVVVSKIKAFIRERSGMNTSQCCIDALTQKVCKESLLAIERAQTAGRKTVMGRDIV